ncbi:hypothetical protein [Streptomyces parvus]|uniref:hypothetical protein n=1 Tax=Streptomyces parvus TaxID=66428 RepID=UPI0033EFEB86
MSARMNPVDVWTGPADAVQLYHGLGRVMTITSGEVHAMSSADSEQPVHPPIRPRRTVEELLAAKGTKPITSLDDLTADTFASDEELEEFVAFVYSERRRDVA